MYLNIKHANGYIEEENENKYLIFDSTDENKELLKKYSYVWNGIKNKTEEKSVGKCDYEKDFMKIKFNSDDDLPLKQPLNLMQWQQSLDTFLKKMVNFIRKLC